MAIRIPNLGTGNGSTGDNELKIRQDYNHNFSDATHAASKIIGAANGQVPLAEQVAGLLGTAALKNVGVESGQIPLADQAYKTAFSDLNVGLHDHGNAKPDINTFKAGTRNLVANTHVPELSDVLPYNSHYYIETLSTFAGNLMQKGYGFVSGITANRVFLLSTNSWTAWVASGTTGKNYNRTTAAGANMVVDVNGVVSRSTSSERYKDILAPLELDDARYADAMALKPIVYRSIANADNPLHHYYSFSAEELGAYDPAFTLWRYTEQVTDADGVTTEQPLAERQAEGININALLAMSHAIAIKQDKLIKNLQAQINALKPQPEV